MKCFNCGAPSMPGRKICNVCDKYITKTQTQKKQKQGKLDPYGVVLPMNYKTSEALAFDNRLSKAIEDANRDPQARPRG